LTTPLPPSLELPTPTSFTPSDLARAELERLPAIVVADGPGAMRRFVEFFAVTIRCPNTRIANAQAVGRFLDFATSRGVTSLSKIRPLHVAAYIESHSGSLPTRKQHLAAIRSLCKWLVVGHILEHNPAADVKGPAYVVEKGKTPVLKGDQVRRLLDSIQGEDLLALRDRALISVLFFQGARISAALGVAPRDLFKHGHEHHIRLLEKGNKLRDMPLHHSARELLERYIAAAGLAAEPTAPIFRIVKEGLITDRPLPPARAWDMIQRRRQHSGLDAHASCHTFRASAITIHREKGASLEWTQLFAFHKDARTTRLYDRSDRKLSEAEVERIQI
jgi:site-specific recombinase XerD